MNNNVEALVTFCEGCIGEKISVSLNNERTIIGKLIIYPNGEKSFCANYFELGTQWTDIQENYCGHFMEIVEMTEDGKILYCDFVKK